MDASVFLQKNKNAILNVGIIILALIISIRIYQSQDAAMEALKRQKKSEAQNNEVFKNLASLDNKVNVYKRTLKIRSSGEVMNTISDVAKRLGLKIDSIRPLGETAGDDYIRMPVSVLMRAKNFNQVGKFMSRLESHPAFFIVDSFSIAPGEGSGLALNLTVSIIRVAN